MNHIIHHKFTKIIALLCVVQLTFGSTSVVLGDSYPPELAMPQLPLEFNLQINEVKLSSAPTQNRQEYRIKGAVYIKNKGVNSIVLRHDHSREFWPAFYINMRRALFVDELLPNSCNLFTTHNFPEDDSTRIYAEPMGDTFMAAFDCSLPTAPFYGVGDPIEVSMGSLSLRAVSIDGNDRDEEVEIRLNVHPAQIIFLPDADPFSKIIRMLTEILRRLPTGRRI